MEHILEAIFTPKPLLLRITIVSIFFFSNHMKYITQGKFVSERHLKIWWEFKEEYIKSRNVLLKIWY
jgi:hypothetical protein